MTRLESSAESAWVSNDTREVVVQEVKAGGWFTTCDPSEFDEGAMRQQAGNEVDNAVRGLFGSMAHSLEEMIDSDSFELTLNGAFTPEIGACLLYRLPMADERKMSLLTALHRDFVVATRAGELSGPWWGPLEGKDKSIVLAIDRSKVPPPSPPLPPIEKAKFVRLGAGGS